MQSPIVPLPAGARDEIIVHDVLHADERLWVPQSDGVAFLPLCLGATQGCDVDLLRGRWYDLEHDWIAQEESFVMEAPAFRLHLEDATLAGRASVP